MSDTAQAWDRDLTPAEVRRLAPKVRGGRVRLALERKVEALERMASGHRDGPMAEALPGTRAALRRWRDPERGLWQWAWPQLDSYGGPNRVLMARYKAALIQIRRKERPRRGPAPGESVLRDKMIESLQRQNAQLVEQVRALQGTLSETPRKRH